MDAAPTTGWSEEEPVLALRGFGVAFGGQAVLNDVNLDVPGRGATVVIGHGGAGKSTLVRSLAGYNRAQPSFRTWGEARYRGLPLSPDAPPAAVVQSARLMVATVLENLCIGLPGRHLLSAPAQRERVSEYLRGLELARLVGELDTSVVELSLCDQRLVAIVRTALAAPALLMVDEPTAGVDEEGREALIDLLTREARRRAILCVTHNRRDAIDLADTTALLVRGRVVEVTPAGEFFAAPRTEAGRRWVDTGSCYMTREELGAPTTRPPGARPSVVSAPRGFHWIWPGALAGMPRPGLLDEVEADLAQLQALGVKVVLCLEEEPVVPVGVFAAFGMEWFWLPIRDMDAPSPEEALPATDRVLAEVASGRPVAIHCRAGLGRTGTLLAAVLIRSGATALDALEQVRSVQPRFVQSDAQTSFLERFERFAHRRSQAAPSHPHTTPSRRDSERQNPHVSR